MAVIAADGNAASALDSVSCASVNLEGDYRLTWPTAATHGALLVRLEDCCGVLEQLEYAGATPSIAHIGGYWAFFVERRSIAELYEQRSAISAVRVALDCYGEDAGLISAFITEQPLWIVEPQGGSGRTATAAEVVTAVNRAMSLRTDA